MEDVATYDEAVETQDGASEGDSFGELQERMAGDETPWYSESEGKVVDADGDIIIDPSTGLPFHSQEEFDAKQQQQATAKPKTEEKPAVAAPDKPLSRSFDHFAKGDGELTAERMQQLSSAGNDYKYSDELIPQIVAQITGEQSPETIDPLERVKADKANWEAVAIQPLNEIRTALIAQGADETLVDELLGPVMQKQSALVEKQYAAEHERAMREAIEGKFKPELTKLETERQTTLSNGNIENLARKYYPEGGKDAFFSLINGHYDEKGTFTRGPAAVVVDLLTSVATEGKQFKSEAERSAAYVDNFRKLTADPAKARALFDLAHKYWLGSQIGVVKDTVFAQGRKAAQQDQQRINRTVKTRPASYNAPSMSDEDDKAPSMLKTVLGAMSRH